MRTITVKSFSFGVIAGSFLTAAIVAAAPAKADPDGAAVAYAAQYGPAVCNVLDEYPSFDGIIGIGQAIVEDGLTPRQAGQVVGISVAEFCPRHARLVLAFVDAVNGQTT